MSKKQTASPFTKADVTRMIQQILKMKDLVGQDKKKYTYEAVVMLKQVLVPYLAYEEELLRLAEACDGGDGRSVRLVEEFLTELRSEVCAKNAEVFSHLFVFNGTGPTPAPATEVPTQKEDMSA